MINVPDNIMYKHLTFNMIFLVTIAHPLQDQTSIETYANRVYDIYTVTCQWNTCTRSIKELLVSSRGAK